ncbi:hypothetical protein BD779DRAFT_1589539 [Infundibulicybe gibba]|nr:hypothetical protein BD779DRAFT_1589539 [Infundibulicybe gibba]
MSQQITQTPHCHGMQEYPDAHLERLKHANRRSDGGDVDEPTPLSIHLSHGLAYTVGSALGSTPPSQEECLAAFQVPNKAGLTMGARAWSKHAHRSQPAADEESEESRANRKRESDGWWGTPSGPVAVINERALTLFWKVQNNATWRNLHWLPHQILVYEARVSEGYGMRWSRDESAPHPDSESDSFGRDDVVTVGQRPWQFRGFVEPMMENGHEIGWRH